MDNLPMFDDPITKADTPKKQKQKPTRKRRRKSVAVRKQRVAKERQFTIPEITKYPPAVYKIIGDLMNLDIPLRNFAMEVTKALTK